MSLQWTLVATVLYVEIALVLFLVIPWLSPKKWQVLFKSRFLQVLSQQAQWYFGFLLVILALFLLDAIREMRKYSSKEILDHSHHLESELQMSMRLFRAQRNFYISGFALFLSLVIRRLVTLISTQATLMAEKEAALKQASSASATARTLMTQQTAAEAAENSSNESHQEQIVKLEATISLLEDERDKALKNVVAMKKQSEGLQREFDLLTEEHAKLIKKAQIQGGAGDNKDD